MLFWAPLVASNSFKLWVFLGHPAQHHLLTSGHYEFIVSLQPRAESLSGFPYLSLFWALSLRYFHLSLPWHFLLHCLIYCFLTQIRHCSCSLEYIFHECILQSWSTQSAFKRRFLLLLNVTRNIFLSGVHVCTACCLHWETLWCWNLVQWGSGTCRMSWEQNQQTLGQSEVPFTSNLDIYIYIHIYIKYIYGILYKGRYLADVMKVKTTAFELTESIVFNKIWQTLDMVVITQKVWNLAQKDFVLSREASKTPASITKRPMFVYLYSEMELDFCPPAFSYLPVYWLLKEGG